MYLLPVVFFFLELWLMIVIGDKVGALVVIFWLIAMIVIGMNLLRYLGAASMLRAAQGMRSGGVTAPAQSLADGMFKALGAVLLIIPGFLTDILALLCFIPLVRRLVLARWLAKIAAKGQAFAAGSFGAGTGGFTRPTGNIYEHQGTSRPEPEPEEKGLLIDQQPESPPKPERKND